ncbi:MAG TPA: DUF1987 domain-containing protein [Bacteroidia bacterium]
MNKEIKIKRSDIYPDIILDKENGIFEIKGISLPENGKEFYQPVLDFLSEYIQAPNEITHFVFNLRFFNISSSKMLLFILYRLKELHNSGQRVLVTWCYDDEDILEAGKDFEHMVHIPFQFKEVYPEKILEKS